MKKENIELIGEEEIDHGYEGPVDTKEEKNHDETKAKHQAGELSREAAKHKSFQARDQVHGQVVQLYQVRYLAGAEARALEVKEHKQLQEHKYQAGRDKAFNTEDDAEYHELIGDDAKYLKLIGDQVKDQVPQDWLEKLLSHLGWYGEDDDDEKDERGELRDYTKARLKEVHKEELIVLLRLFNEEDEARNLEVVVSSAQDTPMARRCP